MRTNIGKEKGIALLLVMIIIVSMSLVAGSFVMSMKVETRLARNSQFEPDLEWMGRSGMELAKYVLAESLNNPNEPYDALNQFWAGGPGGSLTNSPLMEIPLDNYPLGEGFISVRIEDMERKFNINVADEQMLQQALLVAGVDPSEFGTITGSILDWMDPDEDTHIGGTESDYYQRLDPPYHAKNGPIDDITELLMIRGIGPELFWGSSNSENYSSPVPNPMTSKFGEQAPAFPVGLVELFNSVSDLRLNINTASMYSLQLIPGVDESMAGAIIGLRSGPDGLEGTEDDMPFRSIGELGNVPGMDATILSLASRYAHVRSVTFLVEVTARLGAVSKTYYGVIRRNNQQDLPLLSFYWK